MTVEERYVLEHQTAEARHEEHARIAAAAQERIRRSIVDHCACPPGHPAHRSADQ